MWQQGCVYFCTFVSPQMSWETRLPPPILFFSSNKPPLNKLENTHPGVIRRPQTPVICLPELPGKNGGEGEEGGEQEEEESQDFFFIFLSFFSWLSIILSEVRQKKNRLVFALPDNRRRSAICSVKKKKAKDIPYIHLYLMRERKRRGRKGKRQIRWGEKKLCYIWSASYN